MLKIAAIAGNVFREAARDKILYNILFFALGLMLFSLVMGDWSVFAKEKVIQDFSLGVMSLMALFFAVFLGIASMQRDMQRKTILTLLSKPLPRWHILLGKFIGLAAVMAVNLCGMFVFLLLIMFINGIAPSLQLLAAIYFIYLEMLVLLSVALLFSTFSTAILSALFTLGVFIAGHLSHEVHQHIAAIQKYGDKAPGGLGFPAWAQDLATGVYWIIPNFEHFNLKAAAVYHYPVPMQQIILSSLYGLLFVTIFLSLAGVWFSRKDFQ